MPLTPATRLGPYEIVAPLGMGGMGEVYHARDPRLGREIAIKVLPSDVAFSSDRLARFEREARMVAGLNHPNIVTLHSFEEASGTRFLTMELVEGQDLSTLVTSGGIAVGQVLDLAIQLADALAAAHEKGVVHRDLKPANVMLTRQGRVKVLDFGLAKLARPESSLESTQAVTLTTPISTVGEVMGTAPYMAPEQIHGDVTDARTDIFSFGILLYELLAGRRPFTGRSFADVSSSILRDVPAPLASLRSDLPAELDHIVDRCLRKSPSDRFQTVLDVASDLRSLRRKLERGPLARTPPEDDVASIAVLPFVNRSASADDEYFSDGLADELLNVLAKIRRLRVAARTSAFHFKGKDTTIAEIGRALNVATVLEGSVRKAGQRVRISVQLVKVSDGYHLWSETYDRTLDDIFAVQDDIAQAVVKELRTALLGEEAGTDANVQVRSEVARAAKGRTSNAEAHRLYLQARHLLDRFNREDTAKAEDYLKQALQMDPRFALAWAELGGVHMRNASWGWASVAEGIARAREAVEHSLMLEPDLAEGHGQLGGIRISHDWDWQGADASLRRALQLAPGNAQVLRAAVRLARAHGDLDGAIALHHRSLEQDPLSAASYNGLGGTFHAAGRLTEAEHAYRKALELAPQRAVTRGHLSLTLLALGRSEEALAQAMQEPEESYRLWSLGIIHHALGQAGDSNKALEELTAKHGANAAFQIADVHASRGEVDEAFEWLDRSYTQRDPGLGEMKANPRLHVLRSDPRWGALLKKMKLDDRTRQVT